MIFNWFRKKDNKTEINEIETIEILNESGQIEKVDKKKWLVKFNELINKEKNVITKCDMLETAMSYGVIIEVVEPCIKLYTENMNNKRCVDLMFQCYNNNSMYKEAIEVYEKYMNDGNPLNYGMHYELAMVYKKVYDYAEMEKHLFMSFKLNNNYEKAINELKKYIQTQTKIDYYNWLQSIAEDSTSYKLYIELAEIEYDRGDVEKSINSLLKSLNLNDSDTHLITVASTLLEKKRFAEFENFIIPKYDIDTDNIKIHQIILNFYFKDNQIDKGLELLNTLYTKYKENEFFINCEKYFLAKKLKLTEPAKYDNYITDRGWGKCKNGLLKGPMYANLFKKEMVKRKGNNMLILPFVLKENEGIKTPEEVKDFTKNIHIFMNERMYLLTDINNITILSYDDLGMKIQKKEYTKEYFDVLKKHNPNLNMVFTGNVNVIDENGAFEIEIYTYDFSKEQKNSRFRADTSKEVYNQVINKFFNSSLNIIGEIKSKNIDINDRKFMQYYTDYMDIILNTFSYNKYRVYETDAILKYCLNEVTENKMSMALSLIYKQAKLLPQVYERYKNKIYDIIVKENYGQEILKEFNYVYGEKINYEKNKE